MSPERRGDRRINGEVRTECYQAIRECMKRGIAEYYAAHPQRLDDARSREAIERSLEGLRCIFEVLDRYEITRREGTSE